MKINPTLILIVVLFFCSCGEYEKLEIEKEAHRTADSLFRAHKDSLKIYFTENCEEKHDSLYLIYYDSLKEVEALKIRQLLDR